LSPIVGSPSILSFREGDSSIPLDPELGSAAGGGVVGNKAAKYLGPDIGVAAPVSYGVTADIGDILDRGAWGMFQKLVVVLAALSIVLDGFDGQLIGFAIPVLIRDWGLVRGDFAPIVTAGLVGMGLGSAFAGLLGDRFGRRRAVILSVLVFGVATACIGFSQNLATVGSLRFVAGLGIGGALPSSTTMAAEFTPARHRTMAVTATIVCVPLGGVLAGLFAGAVLPTLGWRALFWIGGMIPLLLVALLVIGLPESPRFLTRRPLRWDELRSLLGRMGQRVDDDTSFTDITEQVAERRGGVRALFETGRKRDTVGLWLSFFLCLLAVYSAFSWLPTLLTSQGLSVADASAGLTAYNFGGVFGALACAVAISRYGSRWPLALCCAGAAGSALVLRDLDVTHAGMLTLWLGMHGLFVNAVQSTMYAVCAYVYPTNVRATGTASALAFGRLGAIASGVAGATVITLGGGSAYFGMLAVAMTGALLTLLLVRHHIPRPGRPVAVMALNKA
jgi:AAHS family 4-hydroxybenzoate transporter-like MFS transporter